jgi:hypothetical protein
VNIDGDVAPCCGPAALWSATCARSPTQQGPAPCWWLHARVTIDGALHEACAKCPQLAMFGDVPYEAASFRGTYAALADHKRKKQERAEKPR